MGNRFLIYGATGYSGQLIAAEAARLLQNEWSDLGHEVILAARNGRRLRRLAEKLKLPSRAFALDDKSGITRSIRDVDVVLNAAGPFAYTAPALAGACILASTGYVDICGEIEVYKALDDFGGDAEQRGIALVCGAGHTATLSDMLLRAALADLGETKLGAVQIALSAVRQFSRGSAAVMFREMREQVAVLASDGLGNKRKLRLTHLPIDRLQATIDFGAADEQGLQPRPRIASAANLVDTMVAKQALSTCLAETAASLPDRVASFIEMDMRTRLAYQAGAWAAPLQGIPWIRRAARWPMAMLPDGPTADERRDARNTVVLQIDDRYGQRLVDWRLATPDVYEVTARCSLEVAAAVAVDTRSLLGWQTPGAFVTAQTAGRSGSTATFSNLALRDCVVTYARAQPAHAQAAA